MSHSLRIALFEPYFTGSHARWATDLIQNSRHEIQLFQLPGRFWKWRMEGSAAPLADQLNDSDTNYDLLICSDMMDVSLFKSLIDHRFAQTPIVYYLHENQFNYPRSPQDRDYGRSEAHYGFINYKSCLVADYCAFNSEWHKSHFISALEQLFAQLPDYQPTISIQKILEKSTVLPVPMPIQEIQSIPRDSSLDSDIPILLWNHRWEFDKQPEVFIELCDALFKNHNTFNINFLGQHHKSTTPAIEKFKNQYAAHILNYGYVHNYVKYIQILKSSHILPVTAIHDFFGISVMEAVACHVTPVLPKEMVYRDHYSELGDYCFYNDFDALVEQTQYHIELIRQNTTRKMKDIDLNKYDVKNVVSNYDDYFERIKTDMLPEPHPEV